MGSSISHIEYYLPSQKVTNSSLKKCFPDRNIDGMQKKVGIESRYVVSENETALDLGQKACEKLFTYYDKSEIDFLILCTQSPDYYLPTSSCVLQDRLGLKTNVGAFDINQGCSGFIYALSIAKAYVNSGIANNVLLVMAETYSKHINEEDLSNRFIFGDAASAIIVEKNENDKIGEFVLGTNGEGYENLIVPNGGVKNRFDFDAEILVDKRNDKRTCNNLYMNGSEIFYFVGKQIPDVVDKVFEKNAIKESDLDYYLFHQANEYMINFLAKKLKINSDRYYIDIKDIGNTVSSTIPIALKRCMEQKNIKEGDKVLLCGFGVGYSWGGVVIEI